jgi:hypothetical protein
MNFKKSKIMTAILVVATIGITLWLGTLKNTYYAAEYPTVHVPLPTVEIEALSVDLSKQGIFKKIGQPRKLYMRVRKLRNTSNDAMSLSFDLKGNEQTVKTSFKINSKPFDIQKDTFDLAAGEQANLNLYLNLSKEGYKKGDWKGELIIRDVEKDNQLVGQIPIAIFKEGRRSS